ncbi:DUF6507 family protein [Nocardiopsis sp. EMB25]|uniref:DUF6507 family protein n=1 Tax=Nocardiopsis TaxID=2013 RepID=UPI00034D870D|nr:MULTISPECIES: DUF6507 family protein [Nocardiopsis]MCY9787066.1 DUF6507 family protein [Nocardiopsis sp. EMB25]
MSGWNIDAPGVGGVINTVITQLGDGEGSGLDGSVRDAQEGILDAATSAVSAPVEAELFNLLEHVGALSEEMFGRAGSALEGCADAVDAYLVGNYEMAEEAQRNAGVIDEPDIPPNV